MQLVNKIRLDKLLVELGFFESREKAVTCIMSNGVKIAGKVLSKPGQQINLTKFHQAFEEDPHYIEVNDTMLEYVSRGAYKLKAAHQAWGLNFNDAWVMDIGASTGGFTDYVLKNGAQRVLAIDVGKGQLHYKLRNDSRVINLEKTDFRSLTSSRGASEASDVVIHLLGLDSSINFITIDVSFISLITILEKLKSLINEDKEHKYLATDLQIIALIKPQFEAGREIMDKCRGVIKDPQIRETVLQTTLKKIIALDYKQHGLIESPVVGAKGNIEYLVDLTI